ncbi:PREDICTED: FUN14 domain-containing protein 1-like [Priapulus caudatus]|uniref:FUN14 domain-containing protein 1-like n=1 Tax=Priapulus caudatus TaxID=37621 RepID=A0ABM1EK72_PRICU|nr:PREDICTED: FUN14 domain-containing protein 1-like [Priapulus caudatus]
MPPSTEDDIFEVLDITDANKDWIERYVGDITTAPVPKQLAVSGVVGVGTGYVFAKVSKAAAAAIGGGLLLMQLLHYKGYITVNKGKIRKEVDRAKRQIAGTFNKNYDDRYLEQGIDFIKRNAVLTGGFGAGFLIGFSF